jgi:putative FmdB family regulatory protein
MPLYTYHCKECVKIYELLIKLEDYDEIVVCPECGKVMDKLITPVMFKI